MGIEIIGVGKYLPQKTVTNKDFEKIVDTSDEWITKRTGIKKRHISQGEYTFSMGEKAAREALLDSKIKPQDIGLVIFTTVTADFYFPSMANVLQARLGLEKAYGIDIACACAGFVYALDMAQRYINSDDGVDYVLIVSSENITKTVDYKDRSTCVLFGDGAGAVVVKGSKNKAYSYLGVDIKNPELIYAHLYPYDNLFADREKIEENKKLFPNETGRYMHMDGPKVYRFAVDMMAECLENVCKKAGVKPEDLDIIIPHQANIRIIEAATKKLGVLKEKVYINIQNTGNISSACIPVCLTELKREGKLKKNALVGIVGFGAGMIYGAMIFRV